MEIEATRRKNRGRNNRGRVWGWAGLGSERSGDEIREEKEGRYKKIVARSPAKTSNRTGIGSVIVSSIVNSPSTNKIHHPQVRVREIPIEPRTLAQYVEFLDCYAHDGYGWKGEERALVIRRKG
jgi:hypothetical protein